MSKLLNKHLLNVKENSLSKPKSSYHTIVSLANERISKSINNNKIDIGESVTKARSFIVHKDVINFETKNK